MSNDDQEYEEGMDAFYDDCQRANEIKFATSHGNRLLDAAKKGDINGIKKILSLPLDLGGMLLLRLTAQDENGNYAHHVAAAEGLKEIVMLLLKYGLSVDAKNNNGNTPKEVAIKAGQNEIADSIQIFKWNGIRDNFKPDPINILLVGESPPNPVKGKFFYEGGTLTGHTKVAFKSVFYPHVDNVPVNDFLDCFKNLGCFLDDISLQPVAGMDETDRNYTLLKELLDFIARLKKCRPKIIVSFVKRTYFFVQYAVEEAGLDLKPKSLPFPSYNNVAEYVDGLSEILAREIESGNLSKERCS